MDPIMNKRYNIASIGVIYRKSLEIFASRLEDFDGNTIGLDEIEIRRRIGNYAVTVPLHSITDI